VRPDRFDVAVVGGGTAGLTAAIAARHAGARVCLIEQDDRIGGDCTFRGCVPSKTLVELARIVHDARAAAAAGILDAAPRAVFAAVARRRDEVVEAIARDERDERFLELGIALVRGRTRFDGPNALGVGDRPLRFDRAVIATGSEPALPDVPGIGLCRTNRTIFDLDRLPERLVVLGGGPTGLELAQAFARLGSRVTVVEFGELLLPREEPHASGAVHAALAADGVQLLLGVQPSGVRREGGRIAVDLGKGSVVGDEVLAATGRRAAVEGLGLERIGVDLDLDHGYVAVDDRCRTSAGHVFAAGDVTGGLQFTHVAAHEGRVAGLGAAGKRAHVDERAAPAVTYVDPEVARVGLTEAEARRRHADVEVLAYPMARVDRARIGGRTAGFVLLVTARRRLLGRMGGGKLVGATIVGPAAGELIHECALAMRTRAFTGRLAQTIHAYPSMSLAVQQAAAQLDPLGRLLAPRDG
jgi:pyruvate/2-oxoglutarate dehydrogenase complex dihydrolipoamide dehydrogenase (E3) component